ncbi:MAG: HEAT repeat domain-containing protein [Candidatus Latescibacteria bacterium]|nr:HEAT repeat domain-containing protein [Candidatus Latescibacterota bacterium]
MHKMLRVVPALALLFLGACSTTEQQVDDLIATLAATPIDSPAWQTAVDGLVGLGRPAARQLVAHIDPEFYKGENYCEFRDEIENMRTGCALALGRIQHKAAQVTLVARAVVGYTKAERLACIWAAGELGADQASIDALKVQVKDADPQIRLNSAVALIKMSDTSAVAEVETALSGTDEQLAAQAIGQMEGTNYYGLPLLVELGRRSSSRQAQIAAALEKVKAQVVKQLQADDPALRMHSARTLSKVGDAEVYQALSKLLNDPSNLVRFNAAASLAEMDQAAGIDFLFAALQNQDPILRVNAVKFLTEVQRSSGAVQSQLIAALGSQEALARSGAAQVLGLAEVHAAAPALIGAIHDANAEVRWNTLIALGRIRSSEARSQIESLLHDENQTVAYYAEWALQQLGQG